MISVTENTDPNDYFLAFTSSPFNAKTKGLVLFFLSFFFIIMLFISMYATVLTNPGYFPSPLQLELKLLNIGQTASKSSSKKKFSFLTKFSDYLVDGPLTSNEKDGIFKTFKATFPEKINEKANEPILSNDELIERNKKEYVENESIPKSNCCQENKEVYMEIYKNLDLTKMTLCGTCLRIKVERSHHCRQCQKCILKMDHHCPWLANCIGFGNLKCFILLQLYGVLACSIVAFTYWEAVINYNMNFHTNLGECFFCITVYIMNFGLLAFLLWLCFVNWGNLFSGMTIIENSERKRFPSTKAINIYDMGAYRNFTNVFGRNPLVWFIPFFHNRSGEGYIFETNNNFQFK